MKFDIVVVGGGLIGSAAGKYLSQQSKSVAIVGNAEPADWQSHAENFGSYYDQGRITRGLDASPLWSELAVASLEAYAEIEHQSGIRFYHNAGAVQVGPSPRKTDDYIAKTAAAGFANLVDFQNYTSEQFQTICPQLKFPADYAVLHESIQGGYLNPRELVEAQLKIAKDQGATIIREQVNHVETRTDDVKLVTGQGTEIVANQVLVCAGAWSDYLLDANLGLEVRPRTILLARLNAAEANRLKDIPSVVFYAGVSHPDLTGIYMLPPIRYPDGNIYLKIGGKVVDQYFPESADDLNAWFKTDGSKVETEALKHEIYQVVPGLQAEELIVRPCAVSYTPDGNPLWQEIEQGRLYVCAGGCGAAAKSSNEIGRRAAQMVLG